ncbi:MAG: acetyl-CoA carboxylase biotin carboxyl carrier protein [Oscillospiraceae bacterium]|jgi:acetyl-CoA carboxylase biotin carboxyl carrier protein
MEETRIRRYAQLMQELDLTGLEISENGNAIRLERNCRKELPPETAALPVMARERASDFIEICSPMVGVFYASPTENAPPYVQVGDRVKKGDVLCIIEAMKLMNEITSEQDGIIAEICVGNSEAVDFGRVLFRLRKEQA